MNMFKQLLLAVLIVVSVNACSEVAPLTHLWSNDFKRNIWTYLKLKEIVSGSKSKNIGDHFSGEVVQGDVYILENNIAIKYDKEFTYINDQKIPSRMLNLVIDKDGKIIPNAFIRTFD